MGRNLLLVLGVFMIVGGCLLALNIFEIPMLSMFPNKPTLQFWIYHADPNTAKGVKLPDGRELHGIGIENVRIEVWDSTDTPPVVWDNEQRKTVQRSWDYTGTFGLSFFAMAFDVQCDRTWNWKVIYGGREFQGKVYVPNKEALIWICLDVDSGSVVISPSEYGTETQTSSTPSQPEPSTEPEQHAKPSPAKPSPPLTKSQILGVALAVSGGIITAAAARRRSPSFLYPFH